MEAYDLEIGPIQATFDSLFKRIGEYFQSNPVAPMGLISETDLSEFAQEPLHKTLNNLLEHFGFCDLPHSMKVIAEEDSQISGIHRSDNITTYDEKTNDGSHHTFNFYETQGPENMNVSFYWLDMKKGAEQTWGILTTDDRWYFHIITARGHEYYLRVEREIQKQ